MNAYSENNYNSGKVFYTCIKLISVKLRYHVHNFNFYCNVEKATLNVHIVGCIFSNNVEVLAIQKRLLKGEDFLYIFKHCLRVMVNNGHDMEYF